MARLRLYPLHLGTIWRPIAKFCPGLDPDKISGLPLIAWYIEGTDKKVLVDTGGGDPSQANQRWLPYNREEHQTLESALRKVGIGCEEIDIVVVSHLHWDHCNGNSLFPEAQLVVQEHELRQARMPESIGLCSPEIVDLDYTVVSGDTDITEGVRVILTPGHTRGLQGVLVQCSQRKLFLPSDTLPLYDNLKGNPYIASDISDDRESYTASLSKIASLGAVILPSHDSRVLESRVYE